MHVCSQLQAPEGSLAAVGEVYIGDEGNLEGVAGEGTDGEESGFLSAGEDLDEENSDIDEGRILSYSSAVRLDGKSEASLLEPPSPAQETPVERVHDFFQLLLTIQSGSSGLGPKTMGKLLKGLNQFIWPLVDCPGKERFPVYPYQLRNFVDGDTVVPYTRYDVCPKDHFLYFGPHITKETCGFPGCDSPRYKNPQTKLPFKSIYYFSFREFLLGLYGNAATSEMFHYYYQWLAINPCRDHDTHARDITDGSSFQRLVQVIFLSLSLSRFASHESLLSLSLSLSPLQLKKILICAMHCM